MALTMFETTSEVLVQGERSFVTHVVRRGGAAVEWLQRELPDVHYSEARARVAGSAPRK